LSQRIGHRGFGDDRGLMLQILINVTQQPSTVK
jgi:hypothetical protein